MSIFDELNTNAGGGDGFPGPYINWQTRRGDHAEACTWLLRSKDANGETSYHDLTPNFESGVVFDYHTIKLGWEKHAPMGRPREVKWAPTLDLSAFPRPSDEKRQNDMGKSVFVWQKTFGIRIAIGGGQVATWNQSAFGAMLGFESWCGDLKAQGPQHIGKLPVVQFTGYSEEYGGAKSPTLVISDWIDAPDCLRQSTGAESINTGAAEPAPQKAATTPPPAATPATSAVASAGQF